MERGVKHYIKKSHGPFKDIDDHIFPLEIRVQIVVFLVGWRYVPVRDPVIRLVHRTRVLVPHLADVSPCVFCAHAGL